MQTALKKAIALILSGNKELGNILLMTSQTSISSSFIALLLGSPLGIWLGACQFRGRQVLAVLNRTLVGMPPAVCGLFLYLLFSRAGPFGRYKLLFTVPIMVLAQVLLITPLVVGNLEPHVSSIALPVRETALGLGSGRTFLLLVNECVYPIFSAYLLAFARAIAEVGRCPWWAEPSPGRPR